MMTAIAIQITNPPTIRVGSCGAPNALINTMQTAMSIAATAIAATPLRAPALALAFLNEFMHSAHEYSDADSADDEASPEGGLRDGSSGCQRIRPHGSSE